MAAQNGDESHEHLSLALRPRGQQQTVTSEDPAESIVSGRKPFPLSEIEPHYSREPTQMKESAKQTEEKSELDAKTTTTTTTARTRPWALPTTSTTFCRLSASEVSTAKRRCANEPQNRERRNEENCDPSFSFHRRRRTPKTKFPNSPTSKSLVKAKARARCLRDDSAFTSRSHIAFGTAESASAVIFRLTISFTRTTIIIFILLATHSWLICHRAQQNTTSFMGDAPTREILQKNWT